MQLDELFNYKNEVMKTLCCDERIVNLISDSEVYEVPNHTLAYNQIFPYEYIPETVDEGKTFICFDVDVPEVINKTYLFPTLYIWVFTHKSKMRLPKGGIRTDQLCVEINKIFNGSRDFGLGELNLYSVSRFAPILDYQGRVLTYTAKDFNRARPSKTPPANRKNR